MYIFHQYIPSTIPLREKLCPPVNLSIYSFIYLIFILVTVSLTKDCISINVKNSTVCTSSISTYQAQFHSEQAQSPCQSKHSFIYIFEIYFGNVHTLVPASADFTTALIYIILAISIQGGPFIVQSALGGHSPRL